MAAHGPDLDTLIRAKQRDKADQRELKAALDRDLTVLQGRVPPQHIPLLDEMIGNIATYDRRSDALIRLLTEAIDGNTRLTSEFDDIEERRKELSIWINETINNYRKDLNRSGLREATKTFIDPILTKLYALDGVTNDLIGLLKARYRQNVGERFHGPAPSGRPSPSDSSAEEYPTRSSYRSESPRTPEERPPRASDFVGAAREGLGHMKHAWGHAKDIFGKDLC